MPHVGVTTAKRDYRRPCATCKKPILTGQRVFRLREHDGCASIRNYYEDVRAHAELRMHAGKQGVMKRGRIVWS